MHPIPKTYFILYYVSYFMLTKKFVFRTERIYYSSFKWPELLKKGTLHCRKFHKIGKIKKKKKPTNQANKQTM